MARWGLRPGTVLVWLLLPWPGSGQFQVIGPRSPFIATVGEEAVIPCHLRPPTDAQSMEVRWHRTHLTGLVHHYRNGQDATEQQSLEYQGRTQLLRDNITRGYVALRILPVSPSDGGHYRCSFISSGEVREAQFNVVVTALGLPPTIHAEPADTGSIRLTCSSAGWYPEPEVQWVDPGGLRLVLTSEHKSEEENGLFRVETSVIVKEGSRGAVWCRIRNFVLSVEKEARVSVADALFPRVSPWTVGLAVLLVLLVIVLVVLGVFLGKLTKKNVSLTERNVSLTERNDMLSQNIAEVLSKFGQLSMAIEEPQGEIDELRQQNDNSSETS